MSDKSTVKDDKTAIDGSPDPSLVASPSADTEGDTAATAKKSADKKAEEGRVKQLSEERLKAQQLSVENEALKAKLKAAEEAEEIKLLAEAVEKEKTEPGALAKYQQDKAKRADDARKAQDDIDTKAKAQLTEEERKEFEEYKKGIKVNEFLTASGYAGKIDPKDLLAHTDGSEEQMENFCKMVIKYSQSSEANPGGGPNFDDGSSKGGGQVLKTGRDFISAGLKKI
ncbi:hypothetical protein ACFLXA_02930 [Chloroflexota bacterium]